MTGDSYAARHVTQEMLRARGGIAGTVVGTYKTSFNLEANGEIWNFTKNEDALTPMSLATAPSVIEHAELGMRVEIVRDRVSVGARLGAITAVIPDIEPDAARSEVILQANIERLRKYLEVYGRPSAVADAVRTERGGGLLADAVRRLIAALPAVNLFEWIDFFGAGEGLTPSWDDFVSGVLLADRAFGERMVTADDAFMAALRGKTNRISLQQIDFARMGLSSLMIECFLRDMARVPLSAAQAARILGTGHSSGTEILFGVLLYVER